MRNLHGRAIFADPRRPPPRFITCLQNSYLPVMKNSAKHIAGRIRLMISTKQFQVGEVLPGTRDLGRQLEVSFHTVRKAYLQLQSEGLIQSEQGRGFVVIASSPNLDKSERLEIGAEKMQQLFEELVGFGLDENEIESLFEEQFGFFEMPERIQSVSAIGETVEMAGLLSEAIFEQVGIRTSQTAISDMEKALLNDALFVPIRLIEPFRTQSDTTRILPVVFYHDPDILLSIIDRASIDSIGLITSEEASIPVIIDQLKTAVNFGGSFVAGSVYGKSLPLFVRNTDLIIYTPGCARLVEQKIPEANRIRLRYILSDKSAMIIRSELWDQ